MQTSCFIGAAALMLAMSGCEKGRAAQEALEVPISCSSQYVSPTRAAFLREILVPTSTPITSRFEDDSASYFIDKFEVASELPREAATCGVTVRALLVVGPGGDPFWTYNVVSFTQRRDSVLVAAMTIPHARIRQKSATFIPEDRFRTLLSRLKSSGVLVGGVPGSVQRSPPGPERDFRYSALLTEYQPSGPHHWHLVIDADSRPNQTRRVEEALGPLNRVLDRAVITYPHARR